MFAGYIGNLELFAFASKVDSLRLQLVQGVCTFLCFLLHVVTILIVLTSHRIEMVSDHFSSSLV